MDEEKGLLKFIRDTFLKAEAERPVPDLRKDRHGWYRRPGKINLSVEDCHRLMVKICRAPQLAVPMSGVCFWRSAALPFRRWDEDGSGELEFEEQPGHMRS